MVTCKRFLKINFLISLLVLGLAFLWVAAPADALSIAGSKHDFTTNGTSNFKDEFLYFDPVSGFNKTVDQICVFCHTPHHAASVTGAPLWNRTSTDLSTYTFKPYTSTTTSVKLFGAPSGISALCMSCHDGVTSIAVGTLLNSPPGGITLATMTWGSIGEAFPTRDPIIGYKANIGNIYPTGPSTEIDMSNDHPVSFDYPTNAQGIKDSTLIDSRLRLFGSSKKLECSTCHLVHDNANAPFLAMPNDTSQMCRSCHDK